MLQQVYSNLKQGIDFATQFLRNYGTIKDVDKWQGIKSQAKMFEVNNVYFRACMPQSIFALQEQVKPDLPWAEDHFQERVCGEPLNPGEQYKNWPGYKNVAFNDKNFRNVGEKFTHTYMERYWPTHAGNMLNHQDADNHANRIHGIRYEYGDLNDVFYLLKREPFTRQAYLPVWFPEDTGVLHHGRVPCSIGYHFMRDGDDFHIHYLIRACDYIRHFRNDIYLTVRLAQWVLDKLKNPKENVEYKKWEGVGVGIFTMDIIHFHVFEAEKHLV